MDLPGNLQRLRRQRNLAAVAAVIIAVGGMAVSLPRALERRRQLKETNAELLDLQHRLLALQAQIGDVQTQILQVQSGIVKECR